MVLRPRFSTASACVFFAVSCLVAAGGQAPAADAALHALFEREWDWELSQDPVGASYLGDARWNDRWPDLTLSTIAQRQAHREEVLRELAGIPRDRLSPSDRTHYDVFRYQLEMAVEGYRHQYHLIRTTTYDGVQNAEQIVDTLKQISDSSCTE